MTPLYWFLVLLCLAGVFVLRRKLLERGVPQYDGEAISKKLSANEPVILLDVRSASERQARLIKGSIHIPLPELTARLAELEKHKDREIVCYCATGARSAGAAHLLKQRGFRSANLAGGISAWKD